MKDGLSGNPRHGVTATATTRIARRKDLSFVMLTPRKCEERVREAEGRR
jgi:hypothetical protein